MSELELDGVQSEQRAIFIKYRSKEQELKNKELQSIKNTHQCKKGLFCTVKQAHLYYEILQGNDHELQYHIPSQRQTCVFLIGTSPIKVTQTKGDTKGSIRCSCCLSECLYCLVKTLCGLHDSVPFH
ncbi:E3 14.7K [Simian adenovirus 20]|uniref:E3 14.7K n=1 Tax=Simian adenovirus 20 TaxID=585059 RepID=F6KSV9_9ADEN|nr:E3 14.7K [Simian adenovirus 20]AEF59064.1 E3 14.7K [Simian adenovirus 20]